MREKILARAPPLILCWRSDEGDDEIAFAAVAG